MQRTHTIPSAPDHRGHQTWQCVISSCVVSSRSMFTSQHFQRHNQNCESASTPQSGTSHKTCLRGFGGNGSIAWTSAVSHEGRTSNVCKVTLKLQTFLFQMVVTSCISVQYLWKYGFAKSSDNLYAPCIVLYGSHVFRFHWRHLQGALHQNLKYTKNVIDYKSNSYYRPITAFMQLVSTHRFLNLWLRCIDIFKKNIIL